MKYFDKLINGGEVEDIVVDTPESPTEETQVEEPVQPEQVVVEETTEATTEQEVVKEEIENKESPSLSVEAGVEGSLNPTEPQVEEQLPPTELSDQDLFNHLSAKLGKDVKSYDDLAQKEVNNPLETDADLKALVEWREKTGRPLSDWVNYQKDYDSLSNLDLARATLQHKHPDLTDVEINLDLQKYMPNEDDSDNEAAIRSLNLKKFASEGKRELETLKLQFNSPSPSSSALTQEQIQDLDYATQVKSDRANNQVASEQYNLDIKNTVTEVKNLPIRLSDDLSINYNLTDVDKREIPSFISEMPHWRNADGSTNHEAIVADAAFIKNRDVITKLIYQQGIAKGKDELLAETNNTTTGSDGRSSVASQVVDNAKGVVIEGAEGMYNNTFGKPVGRKKLFS